MSSHNQQPMYDPAKTYEENFEQGPFGEYDNPIPYHSQRRPMQMFLDQPVFTPFGIPAGPLLNANYVIAALAKGYDVVTYKTQRTVPFEVNPFPNVLSVDVDGDLTPEIAAKPVVGRPVPEDADPTKLTITNSFAVPSRGPDFWMPDFKRCLAAAGRGQMVIMSVQGTIQPGFSQEDYYRDFGAAVKLAVQAGARVIEVNLSCPNVAGEGVICYNADAVKQIFRHAHEAAGIVPLIAKLGYFGPEREELLETVIRAMGYRAKAIAAVNTLPAAVVNEHGDQALPGAGRLRSGLCGAGIRWAGLDMVRRLVALREKIGLRYEIIGVGGVMTPADYHAYIEAGANAVQSATGAMWNADLAIDIKDSLRKQS